MHLLSPLSQSLNHCVAIVWRRRHRSAREPSSKAHSGEENHYGQQSVPSSHVHTTGDVGTGQTASSTAQQRDAVPYETLELGITEQNISAARSNCQTLQNASRNGTDNELTLIDNALYDSSDVRPVEHAPYENPADAIRSNDLTLIDNDLYE